MTSVNAVFNFQELSESFFSGREIGLILPQGLFDVLLNIIRKYGPSGPYRARKRNLEVEYNLRISYVT